MRRCPLRGVPAVPRRLCIRPRTALAIVWAGLGILPAPAADEPPAMIRAQRIQQTVGIVFLPNSTNWVVLESSTDLRYWTPVVQVAAQTASVLYVDVEASGQPHRLFRARAPGIELDQAQDWWNANAVTNYSYRFERFAQLPPHVTSALVTVQQGRKSIREATADGVPLEAPESALFPSIPELFAELAKAKADAIRQVWITFDPVHSFPARCTLDRRGGLDGGSTALIQYRVSGFRANEAP